MNHPFNFSARWDAGPIVVIDFETTGVRPGIDRAVQAACVRFEGGKVTRAVESLLNPGIAIPAEATAIHGITDEQVAGAVTAEAFFAHPETLAVLQGAQPCAYNASFDRWFLPPGALVDHAWPWLDPLQLIRKLDQYAKGPGRHKLAPSCARHGVVLTDAHSAIGDATAAGELLHRLVPKAGDPDVTLGELLRWTRVQEANEWFRFNEWLSKQPPREQEAAQ